MSLVEASPPRAGDNSGDVFATARADIEERASKFLAGVDVWAERKEITTDDLAARANDFLTGAKRLLSEAEEARKAEKQPHLDAGRAVDESWAALKTRIEKVIGVVRPMIDAFAKAKAARQRAEAEAARKRAEDAARQAREAEEAAKNAMTPSARIEAEERVAAAQQAQEHEQRKAERASAPVKIASATGLANNRGLKTIRKAKIVSLGAALAHYKNNPALADAILTLANADLRHSPTVDGVKRIPTIPGIEFEESQEIA